MDRQKAEFNYKCTITYGNLGRGEEGRTRNTDMYASIAKEDYIRIMLEAAKGTPIREIEGIEDALEKMTEAVIFSDRYMNLDNTFRKTALKKPREIRSLEFYLTEQDNRRIKKMKDPEAMLAMPEEHMTIYRSDGSSVFISCEFGKVTIKDSRTRTQTVSTEAEYFLSRISD